MVGTGSGAAIENIAPVRSMRVEGPGACRISKFSTNSAETICMWRRVATPPGRGVGGRIPDMQDDALRWDGRYARRAAGAPAAPDGLDGVELPGGGRCLDIACGLGAQSLWAASLGFDVTALDASPVAIAAVRAGAIERGLAHRIDAQVTDLDAGLPAGTTGAFALVICQRFRDPRLYGQIAGALAPGGVLVITVLSRIGADDAGEFHAPGGELLAGFGDLVVIEHHEGAGAATLVARR